MKLLIAGGAGYLGSVLIPKLLDRVYRVGGVDGRAGKLGMRFPCGVPQATSRAGPLRSAKSASE